MNNKLGFVYSITNIITHKIYIGQTINFERRVWEHKNLLKKGLHKNHYMQADYNIYGIGSFVFKIEFSNLNRSDRLEKETELINFYGGIEAFSVYNYQDNIHQNTELREIVSSHQKGKIIKSESIALMKSKLIGRELSKQHRLHIKESCEKFKGDNNPAKRLDVRLKISNALKGEKNGMYGKHHTPEAVEKIRQARLGKSPGNKGKSVSNEIKHKISHGVIASKIRNGQINIDFLKQLKQEYIKLGSYKKVAELHPEMKYRTIRDKILKCNDYLEIE